jgi:hypothetical protein
MIWVALAAGILARLAVAISRSDAVWPDEQFQSLEPAGYAVFGHGLLSWEWTSAYRSWVIPALYMPLLWVAKLLGVTGGVGLVLAARVFTAAWSGWALTRFAQALKLLTFHRRARLVAVAALSLAPSMILWAPTTLADNWAQIAALAILPAVVRQSRRLSTAHVSRHASLMLGLLFGVCFFVKPQMLFWGAGAGLALVFATRSLINAVAYSGGFSAWILAHGAVDWATWGTPFRTLIEQASRGEKTSRFYGVAPWTQYFSDLVANQTPWLFGALGLAVVYSLVNQDSIRRWYRTQSRALPFVFWPPAALFAFLACVPHKELRFIMPCLPFLYAALGVSLHVPFLHLEKWVPRGTFWRVAVSAAMLALTVLGARAALHTPLYLTPVDISRLEDKIYHLNNFFDAQGETGGRCVLLVDHNWSWTRGQLVLGAKVDHLERKLTEVSPDKVGHCPFAIVPTKGEHLFETLATGFDEPSWQRIDRAPSGFSLYLHLAHGARGANERMPATAKP